MRVPDPARARLLIWGGVVVAVLWFTAAPVPGEVAAVRIGPACVLADVDAGPRCPCERWPGRLRLLAGIRIPLATAEAADLEAVPGIGPVLARSIVADRHIRGEFETLETLARVSGIGPRTVARVRPFLSADEECDG